jgi:hypothetical protein
MGQGKVGEEPPLLHAELIAGPADRLPGHAVHVLVGAVDGRIVIAEKRHGTLVHEPPDRIDHPGRIGPVADIIAQKNQAVGMKQACVGEAGRQGLAVAVDVRENGDEHEVSTTPNSLPLQLRVHGDY